MLRDQYSVGFGRERANEIYTGAMSRMYGLVALGIITTGAAMWVGDRIGLGDVILGIGWIGYLLGFGLIFGTLMAANALAVRGRIPAATAVYLVFTGMEGLFLSWILSRFTTETIALAFLLTAGLFVGMSAIGMTTKRDLSRIGPMLIFALIGIIGISLINMLLLQSSMLSLLINLVLLPLFLVLTVWQTRQMKVLALQAAEQGDYHAATQVAVIGSIGLYVNFLNLFLIILNLLGFASDD
jgi:FtsH-binding integral membrane protein